MWPTCHSLHANSGHKAEVGAIINVVGGGWRQQCRAMQSWGEHLPIMTEASSTTLNHWKSDTTCHSPASNMKNCVQYVIQFVTTKLFSNSYNYATAMTKKTTHLKGLSSRNIIVWTKQVLIVTKELVIVGFEELSTCRLVSRQQFLANHKKC